VKQYAIVFHDTYQFNDTANTLKYVIERIDELIFILYYKEPDIIKPIILIDEEYSRLFNNVMHITLREYNDLLDLDLNYKALLKLKKHYAIPFTDRLEPLALYRILADYKQIEEQDIAIFAMHIKAKDSRSNIALYLKKHEKIRDSIYHAYNDMIKHKLSAKHYLANIMIASNTNKLFNEILVALKDMLIWKRVKYSNIIYNKPKRPLLNSDRYPILADFEVVSLMLPDSINNMRILTDGVKPYTSGSML
jgi:hypothetical protein